MNISYKWLGQYTPVDVDPKTFLKKMNMTGTETTGFFSPADEISNVVVGRILKLDRHPNADKLVVCSVDIGLDAPVQIVTAATNCFEGALVPVAKDKSTLVGGIKITKGKLRGEVSEGMFCSVAELGITTADYPGSIEDGILILNEGTPGQDICELLGLDDIIFISDIATNRPDCLSMIGVAREAAATFGKPFTLETPVVKGGGEDINEYLKVNVEDKELCARYCARVVTDIKIKPSPAWMIERLRAGGVRAINNIVDITNYVMLEYGQPMHAFDYSCVRGGEITVRAAKDGEKAVTLDSAEHTLDSSILTISDKEGVIGLAGIMGGENSEIKPDTKAIVFESANFSGPVIRRGAKKLGMRTESSSRFEKGLSPELTMQALDRACELVELLGAGKVSKNHIDIDYSDKTPCKIKLETEWINKYIDTELSEKEMTDILTALGFTVEDGIITVPSFRNDVTTKYDISEEIARMYGYDRIPSKNFRAENKAAGLTDEQKFERTAGRALRSCGLSEIITFSFISPKAYDKIRLEETSSLRNCMKILNPLGEDTSVMRTSMLPSMLEVLARNYSHRMENAALYELGKVYIKSEDENALPSEDKKICIGLYGKNESFFTVKGIIEQSFTAMGVTGCSFRVPEKVSPSYHPGRTAEIVKNGEVIGVFGQLHPQVQKNYGIGGEVYAAELDLKMLFSARDGVAEYRPIPKFPAVTRDLALVCEADVYSGDIEAKIKALAGKLLESIKVFDVYTGEQVQKGYKSIAYSLAFRSMDHTLTEEEIENTMKKILTGLEALGIELRR